MENKGKRNGLVRQWIFSGIGPVGLVLALACLICYFGISSYYINSMTQRLTSKVSSASAYFETLSLHTYGDYYQTTIHYTENFEEKANLELQMLSPSGRVITSSYGLTSGSYPETTEIATAIETGSSASFVGQSPSTGELIIAVSQPVFYDGSVIGVLRVVSSLGAMKKQVLFITLMAVLGSLAFLGLFTVVNLIFLRNIMKPVQELTQAAQRIADGSYGIQIDYPRNDELGDLVSSVNSMSSTIAQNERMQRDFISSVSHELRTPLTAINGWSETIAADPVGHPDQTKQGMGIIIKETKRLSNLVEDLLDFSRIQNGRFTYTMEPLDLVSELEDTLFTYRELYQQDGIELRYEAVDEIFPSIQGDGDRLKQVFCNILDNAAKHGGAGKAVDAAAKHENDQIVITIRDYGPGIPEEELPFVKEKFYKGSSKARGSGIGLAVCEEIVKLHNGTFTIANAEGGGTIVTLSFPTK